MIQATKKRALAHYYLSGAAMTVGMMGITNSAMAQDGNDFTNIASNITQSSAGFPGMISGISFLMGSLLSVLGVMKIKDHVENPTNTPLKEGAIRLTAGGALFSLPIVTEAMLETVGVGEAPDVDAINNLDTTDLFTLDNNGGTN